MIVIEKASNSETVTAVVTDSTCHLPGALNSQLLSFEIWRRYENLNTNITSDGGANCALNERPIKRHIACKAARSMFATVIPVKNHGELQLVSHSAPALKFAFCH
jgi:hypothetical protein